MTIYSEISNGVLLIRPHQAIDHASATDIHERIKILSDTKINALVLDLSQTEHACSSSLEVILDLVTQPAPMHVAVAGASPQFQSLIRLCGANALINEYSTVEEAHDALTRMRHTDADEPFYLDDDGEQDASTVLANDDDDDGDWLVDEYD